MEDNNEIIKQDVNLLDDLEPKQRLFLMLILEGKSTVEAYKDAGYEGEEKSSAYQLKTRLNKQLGAMALTRGCSKEDLLVQISQLQVLPVTDRSGNAVQGIPLSQKIRLINTNLKLLDSMTTKNPSITAIQINRFDNKDEVKLNGQVVLDTGRTPLADGSMDNKS